MHHIQCLLNIEDHIDLAESLMFEKEFQEEMLHRLIIPKRDIIFWFLVKDFNIYDIICIIQKLG